MQPHLQMEKLKLLIQSHTASKRHAWYASARSLQLCLILCDPMDHRLPGSSVHGILQARILEWVAMPSLLKGIFLTQGPNPGLLNLLHWQAGSSPLAPPGEAWYPQQINALK